jgi:hypothetical protein
MKQLIFVLVTMVAFGMTAAAQESKEKVKVESPGYKKKVETEGTHHTALYSQSSHRSYTTHYYARHRPVHRYITHHRHYYHRHVYYHRRPIHHRRLVHHRPVTHYKKIKKEDGEYKVKS